MIKKDLVKNIKGFTLIELLVVTAIIGFLSITSSQIVLSVLKSQDKTQIINEVRQNGAAALITFERDARFAKRMHPSGDFPFVFLTNSSSGALINWICDSNGLVRNSIFVTNEDSITGVTVVPGSCGFRVTDPVGGAGQLVRWKFSLRSNRNDVDIEVPFETSIQSRQQ